MAILQSSDLFVVYKPEVGQPAILTHNADFSQALTSTGEAYFVSVVSEQKKVEGNNLDEVDIVSRGTNLQVALRITGGSVKKIHIQRTGSGYVVGELVTIGDGNARAIVSTISTGGGVTKLDLYGNDGGDNYVITDGLLTDFPYGSTTELDAYDGSLNGNFVDLVINGGSVVSAVVGKQQFDSEITTASNDTFTVGEGVSIALQRNASGPRADVNILSVQSVVSGGPSHLTSSQLKSDVQEWASENDVNLDVEVVDNTGDLGGNLAYDTTTGKLTYTKSASSIGSTEDDVTLSISYGNRVDGAGTYTDVPITTQSLLNQELMYRLGKVEESLFDKNDQGVFFTSVQLAQGALSRGLDAIYAPVATINDVNDIVEPLSQAATAEVENILVALEDSTSFEEFKAALAQPEDPDN